MNDNFNCIYKILRALEKAMDYPEFDISQINHEALKVSEYRWSRYIEMMVSSGLIDGIKVYYDITGRLAVQNDDIHITLKGLEYLSENTIMQRIYKAAKGIKDITPGL